MNSAVKDNIIEVGLFKGHWYGKPLYQSAVFKWRYIIYNGLYHHKKHEYRHKSSAFWNFFNFFKQKY